MCTIYICIYAASTFKKLLFYCDYHNYKLWSAIVHVLQQTSKSVKCALCTWMFSRSPISQTASVVNVCHAILCMHKQEGVVVRQTDGVTRDQLTSSKQGLTHTCPNQLIAVFSGWDRTRLCATARSAIDSLQPEISCISSCRVIGVGASLAGPILARPLLRFNIHLLASGSEPTYISRSNEPTTTHTVTFYNWFQLYIQPTAQVYMQFDRSRLQPMHFNQ